MNESNEGKGSRAASLFPTTQWTAVLLPICERTSGSHAALNRLFEIYRQPIVNYVRTLVRNPSHAEDIAHDFIDRLLVRGDLENIDKGKGRFRPYLCRSIKNFVIGHYRAEDANKRVELRNACPLDTLTIEPGAPDDAEKEFTRQWWRATIDEAFRRLRGEWESAGKLPLFNDIEPLLWNKSDGLSISQIAEKHHLTVNAVSIKKNRLNSRLGDILMAVIGETVGSASEVKEELRQFFQDP